jgi:flagellar protein FlbD
MIDLTRLNGSLVLVNCDLIKFAEAAPDTTLTLITGEKLLVLESLDELSRRITAYRAVVLHAAWPEGTSPLHTPLDRDEDPHCDASLSGHSAASAHSALEHNLHLLQLHAGG